MDSTVGRGAFPVRTCSLLSMAFRLNKLRRTILCTSQRTNPDTSLSTQLAVWPWSIWARRVVDIRQYARSRRHPGIFSRATGCPLRWIFGVNTRLLVLATTQDQRPHARLANLCCILAIARVVSVVVPDRLSLAVCGRCAFI